MATTVQLQHPQSGVSKTGFYGFSWTSFFFGGFPALIRGDVAIGVGMLLAGIIAGVVGVGFGWFLVNLIFAFVYNKMYTNRLLDSGYKLADSRERNMAARNALGLGPQAEIAPAS